MTEHRAMALAPVLDLAVGKMVDVGDTLIVRVYSTTLTCKVEKRGLVDRVIVMEGGEIIPLYADEDDHA